MLKRLFLNETFILILIIVNAITIMLAAFDSWSLSQESIILLCDNIITLMFLIELTIKLNHFKIRGYFSSNWNKMDFVLIVLSIPALVSWIFSFETSSLSFFLVFRVLRVFKSFRFLKFVPGISSLLQGIRRALTTSVIILLGFIVYTFIIGILSCYLFKEVSPEHFSNPINAFYSTFKIFTMEGWYNIPEEIARNSSEGIAFLIKVYFIFILITGGIFGLSLVNSIFVEAMLSDNTDDIEKKVDELNRKVSTLLEQQNGNNSTS